MAVSLNDFLDFVLLWVKKRTGVHEGELVIYPTMVRHCLCCHADGPYAHETDGLCRKCFLEQHCPMCRQEFMPSMEAVGVFCPTCWARVEETWKKIFEEEDQGVATDRVRSLVMAARPSLNRCRH